MISLCVDAECPTSSIGRLRYLLSRVKSILCNQKFDTARLASYTIIIDIFLQMPTCDRVDSHQINTQNENEMVKRRTYLILGFYSFI